jgi:predicted metalloprotease with PDZ domain
VDRSGNEIENCTCIRSPRVILDEMAFGLGYTRRAQLGVWVEPSEDEDGAYVTRVRDGGPAEVAGIQAGDVVLQVNGRSLLDPLDDPEAEEGLNVDEPLAIQRFVRLVGELEPGEEATLEVRRDGERRTLTVTPERAEPRVMVFGSTNGSDMARSLRRLEGMERRAQRERERALQSWELRGDAPAVVWRFDQGEPGTGFRVFTDSLRAGEFRFRGEDPCFDIQADGPRGLALLGSGNCIDGVEFIELNEELGAYFDASRGVLVTDVAEEATLGLRPGDVLLAVDGRAVEDPSHARRIIGSYLEDEEIRLRVMREGREIEVLGRRFGG